MFCLIGFLTLVKFKFDDIGLLLISYFSITEPALESSFILVKGYEDE